MFLIVGLGNIGAEYENTRHNFGFLVIDKLIEKYKINNYQKKYNANIYSGEINNEKVILVKPTTFMNNSGIAVAQIKNFYKIPLENILVFHDDLDLDFCKIKCKTGGGDAGHNGLKSLDSNIGKNYYKIRLGIGRPEFKDDVINFVLSKFTNEELKQIDNLNTKIVNLIHELFKEDKNQFLSLLNL